MFRLGSFFVGAAALSLSMASAVQAAPVTFTATGNANVVGFLTFDDSTFDGTAFQGISNTSITALSLTVFGVAFDLGDVVPDTTFIDSTGADPIIVNGGGTLADNGANSSISFFPDDDSGGPLDGDATLEFFGPAFPNSQFLAVQWVVGEVTDVPEPGTLALFGAGLAALGWVRRRRPAA